MLLVDVYTVNNYSGERNDAPLDNYYLVGIKDGITKGFYIGRTRTIKDTMRLMGKLGYRPASYEKVSQWAQNFLYERRKEEEEALQTYLDSFEDGDMAHWSYDVTYFNIEEVTELNAPPYYIYLFI